MNEQNFSEYYVGELVFQKGNQTAKNALLNGAIPITKKGTMADLQYNRVFTIFWKKAGEYYCLHNGTWYP